MPVRGDTRRRLVTATLRLLRRNGFHGTGLQEVLAESGAPRGSLYFHFPDGKGQLVAEAVTLAGEQSERWMRDCLDSAPTAGGGLELMLERYAVILEDSAFGIGCPVAAVTLDLGPEPGALHAACAGALDRWTELIAAALLAEGHGPAEAGALATTAIAAFEGALLLSRARRDAGPLRAVASRARALLAPAGPGPAAAPKRFGESTRAR
jgi:AcrR family transcriptional regulator